MLLLLRLLLLLVVEGILALPGCKVHLQLPAAHNRSTHILDSGLGVLHLVVEDQRQLPVPIYADLGDSAEARELGLKERLGYLLADTIDPHTVGGHGLAEAKLDPVAAQVLPVHFAHCLHHGDNVRILTEGVCVEALLLDVDLDDLAEALEVPTQLAGGNVLLQVPNEQCPCRLGMVLVQLRFIRPELVVLDIVALVGFHLDLAAKEVLVVRNFQCLLHVIGLLEADQSIPLRVLSNHLHPRDLAVLFVLMEETILEGCV